LGSGTNGGQVSEDDKENSYEGIYVNIFNVSISRLQRESSQKGTACRGSSNATSYSTPAGNDIS